MIAANKVASGDYRAHGATLITIRAGHAAGHAAGPACPASDVLFLSEDVPYGIFAALVGQGSNSFDLDIYLFGIVDSGLHLARVHSNAMKYLSLRVSGTRQLLFRRYPTKTCERQPKQHLFGR